jgi:ATP-dependent DNA helicase RecG
MDQSLSKGPNQLIALLPEADPDALAETMVAFANADGGTLYIGVDKDGLPTDAAFPDEFDGVINQAAMLCRPPIPVEWQEAEIAGEFVFVGRVPRSPELHTLADGRVLVRAGAENRPLTGEQVRQLASTRSVGDYEAETVPGATYADLDSTLLTEFQEKWQERQGHPLTRPLDDLLVEMGWLTRKKEPTVAGLLLFGENPQAFIPKSGLTFVRFEGTQLRGEGGEPGYGGAWRSTAAPPHHPAHWEILQEEIRIGAVCARCSARKVELSPHRHRERWSMRWPTVTTVSVGAPSRYASSRSPRTLQPRRPAGLHHLDNIVDEHFSRNPASSTALPVALYRGVGLGIDVMIEEMVNAGYPPPEFRETSFSFS